MIKFILRSIVRSNLKWLLILIVVAPTLSLAMQITYFGLTSMPPSQTNIPVKVCYVDHVDHLMNEIKQDLANDPSIANMSNEDVGEKYSSQFKKISARTLCQYQAGNLGVEQLPAIVIDNKYVVYGDTNINHAINLFNNYKEK